MTGSGAQLAATPPVQLGVGLAIGAFAGVAIVWSPTELMLSLALAGPLVGLMVLLTGRFAAPESRQPLQRLFLLAVGLRLAAAVFVHFAVSDRNLFAGDDVVYEHIGLAMARAWTEDTAHVLKYYKPGAYHYWNAILFYVFGPHLLLPKALNAVVGAAVVFPTWRLAANIFGEPKTTRLATVLVACLPSLILWSALNLRDPIAILSILLLVDAAVTLRLRPTVFNAIALVPYMTMLGTVRSYMVLVVGLGVALSLAALRSRHLVRDFLIGALGVVAILFVLQYLGFGQSFVKDVSLERMNELRSGLAYGGSAFATEADISTPTGALSHLPVGILYMLFAPFPWEIKSIRQIFTLPEMLLFWGGFPLLLYGIREAVRRRAMASMPALGVFLTVLAAYALVEGNVGTAYRHKAQILGLMLVFGAGGYAAWRRAREAKRRRPAFTGAVPALLPGNGTGWSRH